MSRQEEAFDPHVFDEAFDLHRGGRMAEAERAYLAALAGQPGRFEILFALGMLCAQCGRLDEALDYLTRGLLADPNAWQAHQQRGNVLRDLGRYEAALAEFDAALELQPACAEIRAARGTVLHALGRCEDALASYDDALRIDPLSSSAYSDRASCLRGLGRIGEALADCAAAIALEPSGWAAHNNRGVCLGDLRRYREALSSYDRALALNPACAQAHSNRGVALLHLHRARDAVDGFREALRLDPRHREARRNLGAALLAEGTFDRAIPELAEAVGNGDSAADGMLIYARQAVADWAEHSAAVAQTRRHVEAADATVPPFAFLCIEQDPAAQRTCAAAWANRHWQPVEPIPHNSPRRFQEAGGARVAVAYLCGEFHRHATASLCAGVFRTHDRDRFATTLISYGPRRDEDVRAELAAASGDFVDVEALDDAAIAMLMRKRRIDIAVDLTGHMLGSRSSILALRPAPIQVNFLGYPGTSGAPFIDYIIGDRIVIPEHLRHHYTERVVYMPDTFQANDFTRIRPSRASGAAWAGRDRAFVFCCMNNTGKITPAMLDIWARILSATPGSLLRLQADSALAVSNLRSEARRRGIADERLVLVARTDYSSYLAQYAECDLFLDTLPFNAGSTASDALWMGTPVLTCPGKAFASRMAASLLHAVGLPELVVSSLDDYESTAIRLAHSPQELRALEERLNENRASARLFDTVHFTRNLERAYQHMWERHVAGVAPESFAV